MNTDDSVRHVNKVRPVRPESVEKYLAGKFGDNPDSLSRCADD